MEQQKPFGIPPLSGNTLADIIYYAIFLVLQMALALRYLRRWNWPIFLGIITFLFFEVLGSVAYFKLHYAPVTNGWYSLWLFAWTAGPTFFVASLHLCVQWALHETRHEMETNRFCWPSSPGFLATCLGMDFLALLFSIIGTAYIGAKSSSSAASLKPGFDLMVVSMAIQSCSVTITLVAAVDVVISFAKKRREPASGNTMTKATTAQSTQSQTSDARCLKRPKLFKAFLASLLFAILLLLAFTILRAVDLAGGLAGPLRWPLLGGVETILLFIAILFVTAFHPAVVLGGYTNNDTSNP